MTDTPEVVSGLLDTSVIIDLPKIPAARLPQEGMVSAVTLAELSAGVHKATDVLERAERQKRLQWLESSFDPLPFDAEAGRTYGSVAALVIAMGREPRKRIADLQIASIAIANGLPLYTRNPDDFKGLEAFLNIAAM